jgi:hypothetical protein
VIAKPRQQGGPAPLGLSSHWKKKKKKEEEGEEEEV